MKFAVIFLSLGIASSACFAKDQTHARKPSSDDPKAFKTLNDIYFSAQQIEVQTNVAIGNSSIKQNTMCFLLGSVGTSRFSLADSISNFTGPSLIKEAMDAERAKIESAVGKLSFLCGTADELSSVYQPVSQVGETKAGNGEVQTLMGAINKSASKITDLATDSLKKVN